jgi:hypothetical protein
MNAPALIPPGPSRRRAGSLLLTYGIVGVLLLGSLFAATVAVAWMGRDGFARVDQTIDEVVTVLDSTSAALDQADTSLGGVGVSLTEAAGALDGAIALAGTVSDGAGTLADQVGGFSILGQNPFSGVEQPLRDSAESLDALSIKLGAVALALADNAGDVTVLATRLGAVSESLQATRDRIAGVDTQLGGASLLAVIVVLATISQLMVPAVAAIWVGRRWRAENPKA